MSTGTLHENHGYLEGVGRLRLHYRTWEVPSPRAAVLLVHGLFDHSGRYDGFAEALAAQQFSTFALDLRGHGSSEGRRGHVQRFDVFLQDLDRFRREVQGLVDVDLPLFMIGHSTGGLIALRYIEEYDAPLAGGVLTAPWLGTAYPVPRWKVTLAGVLNRVLPATPFKAGVDPAHLSHSAEAVRAYAQDPLVHQTITPRLFFEVSAAMGRAMQRSDRIHIPLLFLLPADDPIVDTAKSAAFARSLAGDVTVRVVPDAYHDVLNEEGRFAIWASVREWLSRHLE